MNKFRLLAVFFLVFGLLLPAAAQRKNKKSNRKAITSESSISPELFKGLKFRNIGPFRGGRAVAITGVPNNDQLYYMGSTGGGVWKTEDAGLNWKNISDGHFNTSSVGAIAVSSADPNILYVGMGEHPVRGVMTSHGDGVYKSEDGGKTWKHLGLPNSRHIAAIRIHPQNPDWVYVAVQGAVYGASADRGIYRSQDGGKNWEKIFYIDENTGAADLSMDASNPRVLYAGMWDHRRYPWTVRSGGEGSGLYKSVDGGDTWNKLEKGLPAALGKVAIDVSPANPNIVFANIETHPDKAGVYRSDDAGKSWKHVCNDRITIARSWYYTEIFAHPTNPNEVFVLNAPVLHSIDGGKTFKTIPVAHTDQHDMWINPANPQNIALANDGGATITFNGGTTWSTQNNQPTVQFYRVITDNQFPYRVYGGQQDNSTVSIASRASGGIGWKDWHRVAGGESAFLAFDPDDPEKVYGGTYHGIISVWDQKTGISRDIMAYPEIGLSMIPKEMKYRFNWNSPLIAAPQNPNILYHAANKVLRSDNGGMSWEEISPDLTRNDTTKHGAGGIPFTVEGAGGENYNTLSYLEASTHDADVLWAGSDCGLVHLTRNGGQSWENVTPAGIGEALINAIDVSPHDPATAFLAVTKYKFNDFTPMAFITRDYGKNWQKITQGFAENDFVRVVREDPVQPGLLYAGTEAGLYLSNNYGKNWQKFQLNLPVTPITDLTFRDNDLVVATAGRGFWILDDLGAIQQSKAGLSESDGFRLFQPKPTVKITALSGKSANTGTNPDAGLSIDYFVPEGKDSVLLQLEILDESGQVIRTYTSQKDKNYKKYPGGPPPVKTLPLKRGINRFTWDFRRAMLPGIDKVFVFGDYRGASVMPGTYTIRLLEDQQEVSTTTAMLLPDPRLDVSKSDYEEQQKMLGEIDRILLDIHVSVNDLRAVKKQVNAQEATLKGVENADTLRTQGKQILEAIKNWEEQLIQPKQKTFQDVINFPNQLGAKWMNLRNKADNHYPQLTEGVKLRFEELKKEWQALQQVRDHIIKNEMAQYNELFDQLKLPVLAIPRK